MSDAAVSIRFKIEKATPSGRYVSGWLSVVEKDGKVIEDTQGDRISMEELRKGMHGYMAGDRIIKAHHRGDGIGRMIEMVVVDDDFVKAMGATTTKRGAWGTAEITDEAVQKSVRDKKFSGFSMGGGGKRTPVAKASAFRGGSLPALKRLRTLSAKNNASAVARAPGAASRGRRLGRAQSYLTRRLTRQGHVFKASASGFFDRFL